jgi:hypothetical protein
MRVSLLLLKDETMMKRAAEILKRHEDETGRCFTYACKHNNPEGCVKPLDQVCPSLWFLTGDITAGRGLDIRREWVKK